MIKTKDLCQVTYLAPLCPKFVGFGQKEKPGNAKIVRQIKWSIMRIFNETEPPLSNSSETLEQ